MLVPLAEGLWTLQVPLRLLGLLQVGTRMTVVRLSSGALLVHSPTRLDAALRAEVDALGEVRHLVAPNLYHHMFVGDWTTAYPSAALHAPAGLRRKRSDLRIDRDLGATPDPEWGGELTPIPIDGCMLHETVLVHTATRSLISSDTVENFPEMSDGPTRAYLKLAGTYGKVGWPWMLHVLYRDRRAARRSVDRILEQDWDRLLLAHGEVIETGGREALRNGLSFLGPG